MKEVKETENPGEEPCSISRSILYEVIMKPVGRLAFFLTLVILRPYASYEQGRQPDGRA
jgi:hypothetical protein